MNRKHQEELNTGEQSQAMSEAAGLLENYHHVSTVTQPACSPHSAVRADLVAGQESHDNFRNMLPLRTDPSGGWAESQAVGSLLKDRVSHGTEGPHPW